MLLGTTALIVEDEYLIASEMQRVLEAAGAASIIVARSAADGTEGTVSKAFDVALISVGPNSAEAIALLTSLRNAGVAVVAVSSVGEHRQGIPGLDDLIVIVKPFTDEDLINAATAALFAAAKEVKRPS